MRPLPAAAAACLCALPALGAPPRVVPRTDTVVLLSLKAGSPESCWPEAEERILSELLAIGIDVVLVDGTSTDHAERIREIEARGDEDGAFAALCVVRPPQNEGFELWLADRCADRIIIKTIEEKEPSGKQTATRAALHMVELVNASLLELRLPRPPPETARPHQIAKTPLDQKPAPGAGSELAFQAGLGVIGDPGGLGLLGGPVLGCAFCHRSGLEFGIQMFASVPGATIRRSGASARVLAGLGRLRAAYAWWKGGTLSPSLGIGVGILVIRADGSAPSPLIAREDWTAAALPGASAGLTVRITRFFRLRLDLSVGFAVPGISIGFGQETVAEVNGPLIEGTMGVEIAR